jgi:hypothetical protein
MNSRGPLWEWVAAYTLAIACLLWIAIVNRFPILFSDSAMYLAIGSKFAITLDRPMTYGIVIAPLYRIAGLWTVPLVQVGFTLWLIKRVLDSIVGETTPWQFLTTILLLSVFSSLPWFAGQIMPDLFAPLVCLVIFLLTFARDDLSSAERRVLPVLLFGLICFHLSFLPMTGALLAVMAVTAWLMGLWRPARPGLAVVLVALLGAFTTLSAVNVVADGRFQPSLMSNTFLLARLLDGGLAQKPLAEACEREKLDLCAMLPDIAPGRDLGQFAGKPGQYYLWAPASPRRSMEHTNWHRIRDEETAIVHAAISHNVSGVIRMALQGWGQQLISARSADGMVACIECRPIIGTYMKRDFPAFLAARQQHNQLKALDVVPVQSIALMAALLALALAIWRKISRRQLALGVTIISGIVVNAAVCGMLSAVNDRYQSRIMWLLPLFVIIAVLRLWRLDNSRQRAC